MKTATGTILPDKCIFCPKKLHISSSNKFNVKFPAIISPTHTKTYHQSYPLILKFETQKIKVNGAVKCSRLDCLVFFRFCCKHCSSRLYLLYFKHEYNPLRSSCTTSSAQAPCKLPTTYPSQLHVFYVLLRPPFIYFLEFFF